MAWVPMGENLVCSNPMPALQNYYYNGKCVIIYFETVPTNNVVQFNDKV